jgi:hypothetical protein
VNFDFFRRVMENYGFVLMNREEATQFGFPNGGTGMFEGLYYDMMAAVSREPSNRYGNAPEMTEDEKFISFLNRYFIFRKVRHVAAEKITKLIEERMPSLDASKCANAAALVAPVIYRDDYSPDVARVLVGTSSLVDARVLEEGEVSDDEGISAITNKFSKRQEVASKEQDQAAKKQEYIPPKRKEEAKPEPVHFIRPLGDSKITIRVYEPPAESSTVPLSNTFVSKSRLT